MDVERLHLPSSSGLSIPDQSFSRTNSCFSDDLYMSVCESPVPETDVDLDCDFLSLNSRHIDSTTVADSSFQSASDSLFQSDISGQDTGDEALAKEIEEDPVLCTFSHLLKPFNLPHFIDELPRWNAFQDEIRNLRQTDLAESKALEESNMGIYGSGLALRVIEEVRWYNEVSKDPELSRLVHELDPQFPLAMHKPSISIEDFNIATPSSDRSRASSFCIDVPSSARVEEARIRSIYDGVDEFFLRRKLDPSWHFVAANAIAKAFSRSPIRDPRVLIWVQDIVNNIEQAVSLPLCTANSSEMMVGNTIVHLRGTSDWAPPRDAWIFTPMLVKDHKSLLEAQQYKCAGCGLKIEHEYIKRVRVCEYYGKLFCQACHNGSKFIIPAKVLKFWNFTEAPVSDRALRFLTDAKDQAAIHLSVVEPNLIQKISALKKTIYLREKLGHMWEFVRHCEIADETVTGHGNLTTLFTSLEKHLLQSKDVFSLSDFTRVHNKDLLNHLEPIANYAKCHIENCEKCRNRAFVCWLCVDATDLLFPFQLEKIHRCDECGSLAHKICVTKRVKLRGKLECTKCERCEKQRLDRQRIASISEA